jgi:serine/threonine protein kinase
MAITTAQLTEALEKSGLLTADRIKDCCETAALQLDNTMPEAVAKQLVRSGHLTRFQAQLALSGKASSLVIGSYVVLEKIGQGGMGQVYKARHKTMKREVALKVISPAVVKDETSRRRFQREVEAAAQLNHQNIVTAYDAGEFKGTHYLVMEYIKGTDLSSLVKTEGPISLESAVGYIQQVAQGLAFAHSQGIVHRDIKPANLLLDDSGLVKILDMGLARFDDSDTAMKADAGLTGTGMLMGTIDYMSPEQAMDSKNADARSDIYSLGCTLYFLTNGRAMFEADTIVKRLMAHQSAIIPRISHADQELQQILEKMTAKQAEQRYASCEQLIDELQLWLNHNDVAESPQRSAVSPGIGSRMPTRDLRTVSDNVTSDSSDATLDTFAFVERNSTAVDTTPSLSTSDETLVPVTNAPQQIPPTHPLLAAAKEAPAETPSAAKQLVMPEKLALESAPSIIVDSQSTVSSRGRSRVRLQDRSAQAAGGKGGRRSWKIYGGLAGGAALVLLAVLVFRLKTPTGTIIIEADQPDIAGAVISVDEKQTITLETGNGQEPIEIRADEKEHTLKVTKGGFESFTQKFRVKAGATQTITVRLEPAGPAKTDVMAPAKTSAGSGTEPSSASTSLAPSAGPVDYEAERKAAEWVLSVGGSVQTIDEAGVIAFVGPGGKLPDGQWQLNTVWLSDCKDIKSGDLDKLASCRSLNTLNARGTNIGDTDCQAIGRITNLESLDLSGSSQITNAGIKGLAPLKKLRLLYFGFLPISDESMDVIAGMTELRTLHLGETQVTDVGFSKLATLVHLEDLGTPPGVTDQGLSILGNFPQLKMLGLKQQHVTDTSVAQLQRLSKLNGLHLVGATDENLLRVKGLTQLRDLCLNLGQFTDQGFQTLHEFKWLQTVRIAGDPKFDDTRLMSLSEITDLKFVYFDRHCSVSPKGIENFRAARPDVRVNDGVQDYPATVPAKAEGDNGDSAKATPHGMEPSSASTPPAPAAGPIDFAAERKAAEWVLSVGGSVESIDEAGVIVGVGPGGKLPDGQWQLNLVWLEHCKNIISGDLEKLASCRSLKILGARGQNIGDADCMAIGRMANLEVLDLLGCAQITNAGIKGLGPLRKLREL